MSSNMYFKRVLTTSVLIAAFFAVMFFYTDAAHAVVEIEKDGSKVTEVNSIQKAVEAVNSDSSVKDGDDIKFVLDGESNAGNAPAFKKRIDLELAGKSTDKWDSIGYKSGVDETVNFLNAGSVYIHDVVIACKTRIEDNAYGTEVKIERAKFFTELNIANVGTCEIDGTMQEESDPDGYRSRIETLKISGVKKNEVKVKKIKNIVSSSNHIDGTLSDGFTFTYADIEEIDSCLLKCDSMKLKNTHIKELKNTKVTVDNTDYDYNDKIHPQYRGTLNMESSYIDLIDNCTFMGNKSSRDPGNAQCFTNGIAIDSNAYMAGEKSIKTIKNSNIYGRLNGIRQFTGAATIGTIDNCVITGGNSAICQTTDLGFIGNGSIDNIKGDTVLYSANGSTIVGPGSDGFEKGLTTAIGTVRICSGNNSDLMDKTGKTWPAGYSWRNDNFLLPMKGTPDDLKQYVNYDGKHFYYLSYDKCKVTYHPGAGTKKAGFDEYYQQELHGGEAFFVKGFNAECFSGVDESAVFEPMQWTTDSEGKSDVVTEWTSVMIVDQRNYDYYAKYNADTYIVSFDTGEYGSKVEPQQLFKQNAPKAPETPTHPGAVFRGWFLDPDCTESCDFSGSLADKADQNNTVKLYAKWEINKYKVTFNANGGKFSDGQGTKTIEVEWNSKVEGPIEEPKYIDPEVQSFSGWYKTAKAKTEFDFNTLITADTNVYANYEYNKSTITINMDGGTVGGVKLPWKKDADGNIVYKGEVTDLINLPWSKKNTPTKGSMYEYDGLYEDPEFTKPFAFEGDDFRVPATKTYYAKFTPKKYNVSYYSVTYNEYQENPSVAPISTVSLPYGSAITYEPEEYTDSFAGWDPYYVSGSTITPAAGWNGTVLAYEMKLFMNDSPKIIFYSDIAGTKIRETADVKEGASLEKYANRKVDREDYNFVGWTTKPKTEGEYSYKETLPDDAEKSDADKEEYPYVGLFDFENTAMPDRNLRLYPVLVSDRLRVILDARGGMMGEGDDGKTQSFEFTVDINEKLRMQGLNSTTKEGYELDGWYTQSGVKWKDTWGLTSEFCVKDDEGKAIRIEEVGKNYYFYTVVLTALWNPQEIAVEYIGGEHGSTDAPADKVMLENSVQLAAAAVPENGWVFTGWQDSNGDMHSAGEIFMVDDSDLIKDGKLIFTAQYEEKPMGSHTITFDTAGGSYVKPVMLAEGAEVPAPEAPVRDGYEFKGWAPEVPAAMPAEDMTCTAQWEKVTRSFTINFDTTGGNEIEPITAEEGAALTKPADPVKDFYTFSGWAPAFPDKMPSKDMTLSAIWTPNEYSIKFDANGGRFEDGSGVYEYQGVYYSILDESPIPVREGYEFYEWDTEVGSHMPGENVTVKAVWGENDPVPAGYRHTTKAGTFEVSSAKGMTVTFVKANAAQSSVTVPDSVKIGHRAYTVTAIAQDAFKGCKARTVTIKANVRVIQNGAFKGSKVTTLIVKTKKLTKASVKGSLKGSKVKTIKVKVGAKKVNKKFVKKYKKIFTKKNAGKKVKVKK